MTSETIMAVLRSDQNGKYCWRHNLQHSVYKSPEGAAVPIPFKMPLHPCSITKKAGKILMKKLIDFLEKIILNMNL